MLYLVNSHSKNQETFILPRCEWFPLRVWSRAWRETVYFFLDCLIFINLNLNLDFHIQDEWFPLKEWREATCWFPPIGSVGLSTLLSNLYQCTSVLSMSVTVAGPCVLSVYQLDRSVPGRPVRVMYQYAGLGKHKLATSHIFTCWANFV